MKRFTLMCLVILVSVTLFLQCKDDPVSQDVTTEMLQNAPEILTYGSQQLVLSTFIWRDFLSSSNHNGQPLAAITNIVTLDSTEISSDILPRAVYLIKGDETWMSFYGDEIQLPSEVTPYQISGTVRNGPLWGPDITIDVVVMIDIGINTYFLRAEDQYIEASY